MKPKAKYTLENQYQLYLDRMNLKESDMGEVQKKETRRAFFGGMSQYHILMSVDIGAIEDESEAMHTIKHVEDQLKQYWNKQK